MDKEKIEQILVEYGVSFTDALADRLMEEFKPCEDAIRRQDVLDLAKKGVLVSNGNYESVCRAINELPSVNPQPCEDAISRSEVIKSIDEREDVNGKVDAESVRTDIVLMPPVNPQESKTGYWTRVTDKTGHFLTWECNKCGLQQRFSTNFCPDCGYRMVDPQERSDKE